MTTTKEKFRFFGDSGIDSNVEKKNRLVTVSSFCKTNEKMEDWAVLQVILKEKVELRCYGSNERKNICIYDGGSSILVDILLKFQVLDLFMTLVPCI